MAEREWNDPDGSFAAGWIGSQITEGFAGANILLVEDDADIRDFMTTLLRLAGFEPTACSSAEAALEQLREQPFDLVLTDYALPNRTGGWLLQQAKSEGLLDATPALVVTAHPETRDLADFEVIPKPLDLDDLVARITRRLSEGTPREHRHARTPGSHLLGDDDDDDCPEPIELILYVRDSSPQSQEAVAHFKNVLSSFRSLHVRLTVCDLARDPENAEDGEGSALPALGERSSRPRTFIMGHTSNSELLGDMLRQCGAVST